MMRRSKGLTVVEAMLGTVFLVSLIIMVTTRAMVLSTNYKHTSEIETYQHDAFIGAAAHYRNFFNTTAGRCYTAIPPAINASVLVANGFLATKYLASNFFSAASTTVSYIANPITQRVDRIRLTVTVTGIETQSLWHVANMISRGTNQIVFEKAIPRNYSPQSYTYTATNLCQS
ncbi:hypothetical protein ACPV5U_24345 [Vibrio mediterranei]